MGKAIERILLVDNGIEFGKTIQRHLKREGFSSYLACNVSEAQRKIQNAFHHGVPFHLIIMEVSTSMHTGVELLQWIKKTHPKVSVLLLTGLCDTELIRNNIKSEMDECRTKPVTPKEMLELIDTIDRKRYSHLTPTPPQGAVV